MLAALNIAQVNLALSSFARHARENGRYVTCAYTSFANEVGLEVLSEDRTFESQGLIKQIVRLRV